MNTDKLIYFARKKAIATFFEYKISFNEGLGDNLDFEWDNETYTYNPYNNRVYKGVNNSQLTLKKFLKNTKEIEWI